MSRALWTAVGGVVLVLALVAGVQTWRLHAAQQETVDAAVAPAKQAADTATAVERAASESLTVRVDTVTRRLRDTLWRTRIVVSPPVTHDDTARALVQLPLVVAQYDSLHASCRALAIAATDEQSACRRQHAADLAVIAAQDAVLKSRPPRRHWALGLGLGYGAVLAGHTITTGPAVSVGLTWSPF